MNIRTFDKGVKSAVFKSGIFPFQLDISLYNCDGVLIDAGSGNTLEQTKHFIDQADVNCAAITHVHEDHTGAAAWINRNLKVPVYLHKDSIAEASVRSDIPLYRRLVWGNREAFDAEPVPQVIETAIYRLDVYDAPGHHKDHIVLHEKKMGWLFTGDLYMGRKQIVAFKDENIRDAISSLTKLVKLDFDTVFCGHSGIHSDGKKKMQAKLDFFLTLRENVRDLEKRGLSPEEIDKKLFPGKKLWTFISGGEWSSFNMVKTVL